MAVLTKRTIEALEPSTSEFTIWDDRLKGFGVRIFPSGTRKFVLKYRNKSGQQRKLTLGTFPVLTADKARELALKHLAEVASGGDPSATKQEQRKAITVAELCDAYFQACDAGLVLGRGGSPKKPSTLYADKGRIERHVKPLLGNIKARDVKRADIERAKAAIATGKTAADIRTKLRGRAIVTGGKGTATRTLGLLGAIFKWGLAHDHVESNPVAGVQRFADNQRKALLTQDQYASLGSAIAALAAKRDPKGNPAHHPYGLACIRFIALTGLRKGEANNLRWADVDLEGCCLRLGDTKTGASVRPLGSAARTLLQNLKRHGEYVFPSLPADRPYGALPRLWKLIQRHASANDGATLEGLSLHSLRHSFAGTAEELGCSLPTIAALLGHRLPGVTSGYILKRLDRPLISAADRVSEKISEALDAHTNTSRY